MKIQIIVAGRRAEGKTTALNILKRALELTGEVIVESKVEEGDTETVNLDFRLDTTVRIGE